MLNGEVGVMNSDFIDLKDFKLLKQESDFIVLRVDFSRENHQLLLALCLKDENDLIHAS